MLLSNVTKYKVSILQVHCIKFQIAMAFKVARPPACSNQFREKSFAMVHHAGIVGCHDG